MGAQSVYKIFTIFNPDFELAVEECNTEAAIGLNKELLIMKENGLRLKYVGNKMGRVSSSAVVLQSLLLGTADGVLFDFPYNSELSTKFSQLIESVQRLGKATVFRNE